MTDLPDTGDGPSVPASGWVRAPDSLPGTDRDQQAARSFLAVWESAATGRRPRPRISGRSLVVLGVVVVTVVGVQALAYAQPWRGWSGGWAALAGQPGPTSASQPAPPADGAAAVPQAQSPSPRGPSETAAAGTSLPETAIAPPPAPPVGLPQPPPAAGGNPAVPSQRRSGQVGAPPAPAPPVAGPVAPPPPPPPGVLLVGSASGRCIGVPNGLGSDGTRLQIWDCGGASSLRWDFGSDGTVRALGLCMDVAWGSTQDGAAIQLARCSGNRAQLFYLAAAGDLVNPQADKCVDVMDKGTANGTWLQLWTCSGTANQKWRKG